MYTWTLTDTSPDADPNGAPIAEGTEATIVQALDAAAGAVLTASFAAGIEGTIADWENTYDAAGSTVHRTYDDGTRLTVRIDREND